VKKGQIIEDKMGIAEILHFASILWVSELQIMKVNEKLMKEASD